MRTQEEFPPLQPSPLSGRRAEIERLEAQLAEWTALIAQCRAHAKRAEAAARIQFEKLADDLQFLRNEAGAQVMLLKGTPGPGWQDAFSELDRSWGAIRSAFRKAETRI